MGVPKSKASYDLTAFSIKEATECGQALRTMDADTGYMEDAANGIVRYLYDSLTGAGGQHACALVRLYKTHPYTGLEGNLQRFASALLGGEPTTDAMKCLTLLASAGDEPQWNDRHESQGHKAIPLPGKEAIRQAPMISNLIKQFGLDINLVVNPDAHLLLDQEQRTYNVFHVPEAAGSPFIPAQENFVAPYGIKSVLGFGGLLPSGDMFAVIMFFKLPVTAGIASLFKPLSLNVKMALLPYENQVFHPMHK